MIKAEFKSYGSYTTDSVSQWDLNQKLTISGLDIDVAPVLAFSCFGMYESIIVQSKLSDGVITCDVPNAILQFGKNLNVDLCSETGGQYKAFEKMIIPVNRRKKPSDYLFTDNVQLSTTESIKADLEKEINSNKTYMDKVKTELKNENKTLNGRIDTILTGAVNTTKLVTVHSATIRNNSASDLTFKISSKDNETLKSIKDKSPTVINANVIAKALDGVAINGKGIPSSYNVESTNDEYVITVYSGSSSVVGQYVFMAVVTIAYEDIATDISSAELKDVRVGTDGITYESAGVAVRQQIGSLKSDTSRIKKSLRTTYVDMNLFALGTINKDTGEEESSNKILRSIIDVNATEDITIKLPKGYQWNVAHWLGGKYRSDLWNENSWYQNLTIEKTTANYKYRILIRRSDGADITLSELIGVAETNREDLQSFDKIDDLKKKLNSYTEAAETSAQEAEQSKTAAETAAQQAEASRSAAQTSEQNAAASRDLANTYKEAAETAKSAAETAAQNASESKTAAETAAQNAAQSKANIDSIKAGIEEAAKGENVSQIKKNMNDIGQLKESTAVLQKRQNVLVGSETGNPVSCDDAFAAPLCGLTVYGKSTQDGTPSPDAPVPIVSAGDGGSVAVKVTGKNRMPPNLRRGNFVECYVEKNTQITVVFKGDIVSQGGNILFIGENNEQTWIGIDKGSARKDIALKANATKFQYLLEDMASENVCMTWNASSPDYEPYREQLLTLPTPNGLPGIPVASGGNYTDPQGQQWVCDEVDLKRGVKVQRVDKAALDSTKALAEQNAILTTPIETPLTPAEIAAYKALTAYGPDTVVQAGDGAGVRLDYQRDVNIAIKRIEDAVASMT